MPVNIEWVESPSEQDWSDLQKLYNDAPSQWFNQDHDEGINAYIEQHLNHQDWKLAAGRFNDRLIAAASLKASGSGFVVTDLCVRKVTRSRGVAHQMLVRLAQWADEHHVMLEINDSQSDFTKLKEYGFNRQGESWVRPAKR